MITNTKFPLEVKECDYKGEHYSAREDGMVMRHHRNGMRKRKLDDVWTYGVLNATNGYLFIGTARVHIIVATAFYGPRDTTIYVVDHIDTNRQNNRPDNLRWLTRLGNALLNEITRKKIELICGSIPAFLENPSLLRGHEPEDKNFGWMKNVSKEEARNCFENWMRWARTTRAIHNPNYYNTDHHVGDWIYERHSQNTHPQALASKSEFKSNDFVNPFINIVQGKGGGYKPLYEKSSTPVTSLNESVEKEYDGTTESLTPSARQRCWFTPTEFPFCPENVTENGLQVYLNNLKVGEVFSRNEKYDPSYVADMGMGKDNKVLFVLTTNPQKDDSWAIAGITIENNKFVHENEGARGGYDLTTKVFKSLIGQEKLSIEDFECWDALN